MRKFVAVGLDVMTCVVWPISLGLTVIVSAFAMPGPNVMTDAIPGWAQSLLWGLVFGYIWWFPPARIGLWIVGWLKPAPESGTAKVAWIIRRILWGWSICVCTWWSVVVADPYVSRWWSSR